MVTQKRTIGEETHTIGTRSNALLPSQIITVIVFGVIFWFVAALIVRFGAPMGFFGPTASIIAFALAIPGCWLSVLVVKRIARLEAGQMVAGIVIGTVTATLCDGIALTWARGLFYGSDPTLVNFGAAWILWGAGLFLLFAYLDDQRQAIESMSCGFFVAHVARHVRHEKSTTHGFDCLALVVEIGEQQEQPGPPQNPGRAEINQRRIGTVEQTACPRQCNSIA